VLSALFFPWYFFSQLAQYSMWALWMISGKNHSRTAVPQTHFDAPDRRLPVSGVRSPD
jgi:hypothetical protein